MLPAESTLSWVSRNEALDSELRFRRLFEAAQDGILIVDAQSGAIIDANPFFAKLLGIPLVDVVGNPFWDVCTFSDPEVCRSIYRQVLAKNQVHYDDLLLNTTEGFGVHVEVSANLYLVRGNQVVQCHIRDIRQRKNAEQLEQRIRQAQKMEAVGQLAGGVAHDFNNLLGVILGYCEMLETRTDVPDDALKMIGEIHNAGNTAKNLTQRLLVFSRRQIAQPEPVNLNETVTRMEKMLARLIGEDIELVSILGDTLGEINVDPSQIEQVLMNLAINSRDAMPQGGKIAIETANTTVDPDMARQYPTLKPGNYVRLSFSDTGVGMDQETQSHIFEPFFSTKGPGQGTGLGLSTVFAIVSKAGGVVSVYSELGHGTTFKMFFPRHDQMTLPLEQCEPKAVSGGTETILVVDDAAPLRKLTRKLLEESGYRVLDSGDPAEALRIAEEHPGPLPLVITDVVMPGMNGFALGARITARRAESKILLVSGYNDESITRLQNPGERCAFLEKPFTRAELLSKVRELLGEDSNAHASPDVGL